MSDAHLLRAYNYDAFTPDKFGPWMRWEQGPKAGETAPDFTLWTLDEHATSLRQIISQNRYTVVEFGSFT